MGASGRGFPAGNSFQVDVCRSDSLVVPVAPRFFLIIYVHHYILPAKPLSENVLLLYTDDTVTSRSRYDVLRASIGRCTLTPLACSGEIWRRRKR